MSHPVAVGVSFNFNKVTEVNEAGGGSGGGGGGGGGFLPRLFGRGLRGVGQGTGEDDAGARRLLQQAGSNIRSGVDVTALSSLFETVDFVGISAYASLPPDFKEEVRRRWGWPLGAMLVATHSATGSAAGVAWQLYGFVAKDVRAMCRAWF